MNSLLNTGNSYALKHNWTWRKREIFKNRGRIEVLLPPVSQWPTPRLEQGRKMVNWKQEPLWKPANSKESVITCGSKGKHLRKKESAPERRSANCCVWQRSAGGLIGWSECCLPEVLVYLLNLQASAEYWLEFVICAWFSCPLSPSSEEVFLFGGGKSEFCSMISDWGTRGYLVWGAWLVISDGRSYVAIYFLAAVE